MIRMLANDQKYRKDHTEYPECVKLWLQEVYSSLFHYWQIHNQMLRADWLVKLMTLSSSPVSSAWVPWKGTPLASLRWHWLDSAFLPYFFKVWLKRIEKQKISLRDKETAIQALLLLFYFLSFCKQVCIDHSSPAGREMVWGDKHQEIFNIGVESHQFIIQQKHSKSAKWKWNSVLLHLN